MPTISVITPTFNRANVISEAIASVQRQTQTDFEHIIVDDGSTDDTPALMDPWIETDDRIDYIRLEENHGHAYAQNRGVEAASGDFIAILDSDDVYLPQRLAIASRALRGASGDIGGVFHPFVDLYDSYSCTRQVPTGELTFDQLAERNVIAGMSNTLYRQEVFDEVGGFDTSMASTVDYEFQLRVLQQYAMEGLENVLSVHRKDVSGIQDTAWRKRQGLITVLAKHQQSLSDRNVADRLVSIGRACLHLEKCDEAEECFELAMDICPKGYRGELARAIGVNYLRYGKKHRARSHLRTSVRHDPINAKVFGTWLSAMLPGDGKQSYLALQKCYHWAGLSDRKIPLHASGSLR